MTAKNGSAGKRSKLECLDSDGLNWKLQVFHSQNCAPNEIDMALSNMLQDRVAQVKASWLAEDPDRYEESHQLRSQFLGELASASCDSLTNRPVADTGSLDRHANYRMLVLDRRRQLRQARRAAFNIMRDQADRERRRVDSLRREYRRRLCHATSERHMTK